MDIGENSIADNNASVYIEKELLRVYSHILDEDRRNNATRFEEAFYQPDNASPEPQVAQIKNEDATKVMELLDRTPELAAQLLQLLSMAAAPTANAAHGN